MSLALGIGSPLAAPVLQRPTRSTETRAIAARLLALATPLSYAREQAIEDVLVRPLVAAGLWAKLDTLRVYAAHSEAASLVNLISPSTGATNVGSTPFEVDSGFNGDGVGYIRWEFNPSAAAGHYALDSAHLGVVVGTDAALDFDPALGVGSDSGTNQRGSLNPSLASGAFNARINDSVTLSIPGITTTLGHWGINRSGASARQAYHDGAEIGSDAQVSSSMPNAFYTDLRSATSRGTRLIRASHAGGSLTAGEWADMKAILAAYLAAVDA